MGCVGIESNLMHDSAYAAFLNKITLIKGNHVQAKFLKDK